MKRLATTAFLLFACSASPADSFRLEGQTYQPSTNIDIVWKATNDLPHGLWVYKVMPEAFSAAVVSNAMAIGHFQMKDLAQPPNKNEISFKNKNELNRPRFLSIAPTIGEMKYSSQRDSTVPVEDVPSSQEIEKLARDVLFQLGIDRSLLADRVRSGYDETSTKYKYDRQTHQAGPPGPTQVVMRGISFERRVDGILLSDSWCFLIHFGNHGTIEDFSLKWRNILPYESHRVLTPKQFIEAIKSGKAVLPEQFGDLTDLSQAKKIAVINITPRYYNGRKGEALEFLHPYADLELAANLGSTNTGNFFLTCPILDEGETKRK